MNIRELSIVNESKRHALFEKMKRLGIDPSAIEESFVKGSGKGGQKVNKTANAVQLFYPPLDITVRAHRERERSVNRFLALRELIDEIEFRISPETSSKKREWEKIRKQKDRRARRR